MSFVIPREISSDTGGEVLSLYMRKDIELNLNRYLEVLYQSCKFHDPLVFFFHFRVEIHHHDNCSIYYLNDFLNFTNDI
jgi:hypothetical protein